jgi:hypothetical protein
VTSSPTFVAVFDDWEKSTTRMTVFHSPGRQSLDLGRGGRLAQTAYRSRTKQVPPAIVAARFERDGRILQTYTAKQITDEVNHDDTTSNGQKDTLPQPS